MEPNTTPAPVSVHDGRAVPYADLGQGSGAVITPATPVRLHLRTVISMIVGIVTLVLGGAGGYYALASTDRTLELKAEKAERKASDLEKRLEGLATRADLRELRLQVRMDMLSAVWDCTKGAGGAMQCRQRLPHGYAAGDQ
jgi:hypothetical protein